MALLFFHTPDRGDGSDEGGYANPVGNVANGLGNLGFVDSGLTTDSGTPIFVGTVNATQTGVTQPTPDPDANEVALLSRSIARTPRAASTWVIADVGTWARSRPPGTLLYVTFR